jgi:16S rRNA (cytosine1402-N4)-methyltransferase
MTAHIPVLLQPILDAFLPAEHILDGTVGAGGHSAALLENGAQTLLGLDRDTSALELAREKLSPYGERARLLHMSYADMRAAAAQIGWEQVDGILLDLGVSSMQFDRPERGFAFRYDGPLDMRFDMNSSEPPAADIINYWDANDLADIFYRYGEERHGRKLAHAIVNARPLATTRDLVAVIERVAPRRKSDKIHPATRVFQALRIAVNDELGTLERALPVAIDLLRPGGRLAVISFHSLEDRLVKHWMQREAATSVPDPASRTGRRTQAATVELITRKPVGASSEEIQRNPRSRSAKLRIVKKLSTEHQG